MAAFAYNGITLPYTFFTRFNQTAKADESGTDWYCTEFDIEVQTIINANYVRWLASDLVSAGASVTENAADIMHVIRSRLLERRKTLSVQFNGVELIPKKTAGRGTVDVQNGPQPQSCTLYELMNNTFLLSYHIKACYWENNDVDPDRTPIVENQTGNGVLYNRWQETVDIDACQFSVSTREGRFVIRSDNADGRIVDSFRNQFAVTGLRPEFNRVSTHYTVDPSGLALQYRIVDREVFKHPPAPAYEAEGEYTETTTHWAAKRIGEVRIRLKGSKTTPQEKLIETAVGVASAKLILGDGRTGAETTTLTTGGGGTTTGGSATFTSVGNRFALLEHASITVDMYNNVVEVRMRAWMKPYKRRKDNVAGFRFDGMAWTPGSEPGYGAAPPNYTARGSADILLQAAAYYDPSLATTVLNQTTNQHSRGSEVGTAGVTQEV